MGDDIMRISAIALLAIALFVVSEAATKKRRSARDWDKIVDDEVDKMMQDEEEERQANAPQQKPFDPDSLSKPGAIDELMAGQKAGKPAMMFVTVDTKDREETEAFAGKSRSILKEANGLEAQSYVIEDDKLLFSITDGSKGFKLRDILLSLPEVVEFEWDQQKSPGKAKEKYEKKKGAKEL